MLVYFNYFAIKMISNKPAEVSLPEGWVWKTSRKYPDRIYYCNITTGETTWDFPKPDYSKSEIKKRACSNEMKNLTRAIKGSKRSFDASLPKNESTTKGSSEKKFCKTVPVEVIDLTHDKVKKNRNSSFSKDLHPEISTPLVKPIVKKKKKRKKKKSNLLIEETVSLTCRTNLKNPFVENCNVKHAECKRKEFEPENTKNIKGLNKLTKPSSELCNSSLLSPDVTEDIEMLDVSVDLTKIADLQSSSSYYIVVDTNIFVHEIDFIDEIKDTPLNNCGPPHIFIPWVVIQELEHLRKRNPESSNIFRLSHKGMKYINNLLKAKHPRFHGQSPKEMKDCAQAYSQNNDDRVLECCINLYDKMPSEKVLLLTNDLNLVNKAMICNISAYDIKTFQDFLKKLSVPYLANDKKIEKEAPIKPNITIKESFHENRQNDEFEETMLEARQMLKDVLISLLNIEMEDAYGAVWKAFKLDLSNLKGILRAVMKYWRMVFSFHFSFVDKENFEFLLQVTNRPKGYLCDKKECLKILRTIETIFFRIDKKWPTIKTPIEKIKKLQSDLQNPSSEKDSPKMLNKEFETKPSDDEVVLSVFEHNWVTLNHLTGMFLDFYQIPHTFSYDKPAAFPPASQFERLMCNLLPAVQLLKVYMSKIVDRNSNSPPPDIKLYKKFCDALTTFVPSLEIDIKPVCTDFFTEIALKNYCDSIANQEKLCMGYKQLETFSEKLSEVAVIISSNNTIKSSEMVCEF